MEGCAAFTIFGPRHTGAAKELDLILIIMKVFAPSRETTLPPNNLFLQTYNKNYYVAHLLICIASIYLLEEMDGYCKMFEI